MTAAEEEVAAAEAAAAAAVTVAVDETRADTNLIIYIFDLLSLSSLSLSLFCRLSSLLASLFASSAASDDGEIRPITIPIPSGGSGGSGTGRGDSGGEIVGDA